MQIKRSGGLQWLVQAISGFALTALLGLHMIANHFVVEGGLRTYQDVLAYLSNPAIFILEVLFLLVVVPHAFLGLRAILLDLGPKPRTVRVLDAVLIAVGTAALLYGIALFVVLQGRI
jgi:succinate dehydrogenase / fumarate reductase membrane anchor subunit